MLTNLIRKRIEFGGEIPDKLPNCLLGTNVCKTYEFC